MSTPDPSSPDWPCRSEPDADSPPRLLAFLYLVLRDGAQSPGDVEQLALNVRDHRDGATFTNPHLERYARSLSTFLLTEHVDVK